MAVKCSTSEEAMSAPQFDKSNAEAQQMAKKRAEQQEQEIASMLSQILEQDAIVRLTNLSAVKPAKAKQVEMMLINMARRNQIQGKISDAQLKSLMEKANQSAPSGSTVKFDRRRNNLDSDDDDM